MFFWYFSPFFVICAIISIVAEVRVKTTFDRFSRVMSRRGYSAEQVARMILDRNNLRHIRIEYVNGHLTDHYDPRAGVIRLSLSVAQSSSVAAIGVAAHECGHAMQYEEEYAPIVLRNAIVKSTNICSRLSFILIMVGVLISYFAAEVSSLSSLFITLGIIAFSVTTFFQLITLPVEFNASRRAMATIEADGILMADEQIGARKVLKAAAMTYVAALVVSILQLLRLIAMFRRRD